MENRKETLKTLIKRVEKEIQKEPSKNKKQRLNKYKQKLQIELRDYTSMMNGRKYETV